MIRFQEFRRDHLRAVDGSIGAVYDLYFDDMRWQVRYIVVDTRRWLPGRKVLIAPEAIRPGPWEDGVPVNLTRDQVKDSPGFETDLPVSRQNEEALVTYYQWAQRFARNVAPAVTVALPHQPMEVVNLSAPGEPRLRSAREIVGYEVVGPEGTIGDVTDLRFDRNDFAIQSLEVDPRSQVGLPVIPVRPSHVERVRWNDRTLMVDLDFGSLATFGGITGGP